jgi:ribonuclease HI
MWKEKSNSLYREFILKDFDQARLFMQTVAKEMSKLQHYPRWENEYNRVQIWLRTHDACNAITDLDRALAKAIDKAYDDITTHQSDYKTITGQTELKLYTDGGSRGNPGPSASGFVILDKNDNVLIQRGVYLGITTNNQAEYRALKLGLEETRKMQAQQVDVYMDSLLIVNQMLGKFKVKNSDLLSVYDAVNKLIELFDKVTFTHVPREFNKLADAMVNKALDEEPKA